MRACKHVNLVWTWESGAKVNTEVKMEVERREMRSRRLTEHAASVLSWVKVVALSADFDCLRGGVGPPAIMREEWRSRLYVVEAKSESREAKEALSDCGISERAHCRERIGEDRSRRP